MATRSASFDLRNPDPVGQDLALYRTRAYRFTDDLRHYVVAEELEERHIHGSPLSLSTLRYIQACLDGVRTNGWVPDFDPAIADTEHIDLDVELNAREPYRHPEAFVEPDQVVAIVGAPRSGTSHLYNLLAYHGRFAYFTTVTCWAWPTRNLTRPGRRLFTHLGEEVFAVDNKKTRLLPGLVMPYEVEDIYARALPTYCHMGRHRYELQSARRGSIDLLTRAASAHLAHFDANVLLTKSPFNSLRIPLLEQIWGPNIRYIHMVRDQRETADSMRRNHFEFEVGGRTLTAEEAWSHFVTRVWRDQPLDRHIVVNHAELLCHPGDVVGRILNWLKS